jgi:hypothetical protein
LAGAFLAAGFLAAGFLAAVFLAGGLGGLFAPFGGFFRDQLQGLVQRHIFWGDVFGQGRVDFFPLDIGAIAPFEDGNFAPIGVLAQLFAAALAAERPRPGLARFSASKLHGAVHANLEDIVGVFEVGVGRFCLARELVHDVGAKTPEIGGDLAAFGVQADLSAAGDRSTSAFSKVISSACQPFGSERVGFFVFFRRLAALHIGAEAA